VVLTFGGSNTVYAFLKEAAKKRQFSTVVAEAAPGFRGHQMAKRLAALPNIVQTTVITDAAIFAMMARVNMVVVGARAVLANGGIMGSVGLNSVALAAQRHSVPFVVLTGLHKLSPEQVSTGPTPRRSEAPEIHALPLGEETKYSRLCLPSSLSPAVHSLPPYSLRGGAWDLGRHSLSIQRSR
jgi:translation initiation factor 2B subunit (eIF-2B alpha/beta/delta family)